MHACRSTLEDPTGGRPGWGGFDGRYHRPFFGHRLPRFFVAPSFFITNWWLFGLPNPGYGRSWVRYYDDAVLVDGDGRIYDSRYGLDWDRDDYADDSGSYDDSYGSYDDSYGSYGGSYGGHYDAYPPRPASGAPYVYQAPVGSTTVIIQSAPTVTTTTTTTEYVERYASSARRTYRARPRPRRVRPCPCVCTIVCR